MVICLYKTKKEEKEGDEELENKLVLTNANVNESATTTTKK